MDETKKTRTLNVDLYPFRWFAVKIVESKKSVKELAERIDRSPHTIYNWLAGLYLDKSLNYDSTNHSNKYDVAPLIAKMLHDVKGCDINTVREEIKKYLLASGKLYNSDDISSFRSELSIFMKKIKSTCHYDSKTLLSTEKKELILAMLNALDKI